jgi:D-amino peptidase
VRVHIISDIEGVAGIVNWGQASGAPPSGDPTLYDEARKLYTAEINAAVRGAKKAGAKEIVVMDCHGAGGNYDFNSLIPERLEPDCEFVVQHEWTEYTSFLEQGCDAALFVGMHAKAGTPDGVLSHTVSGQGWRDLRFNGVSVGETGINAALCGNWGCPVLLVTGDRATCNEASALLGNGLTTVEVKVGLGRFSARSKTPQRACELIEDAAREALKDLKAVAPYNPGRPCEIEIEFTFTDRLVEYRNRRGVEVTGPMTLASRADDWWTAWSQFYF